MVKIGHMVGFINLFNKFFIMKIRQKRIKPKSMQQRINQMRRIAWRLRERNKFSNDIEKSRYWAKKTMFEIATSDMEKTEKLIQMIDITERFYLRKERENLRKIAKDVAKELKEKGLPRLDFVKRTGLKEEIKQAEEEHKKKMSNYPEYWFG